jgi:hydroxymethylpyrimidine kinase/phosphomethylpyrimidine kinase
MAPRKMKTDIRDSGSYFRSNRSCHASGVTPAGRFHRPMGFRTETDMKTGSEGSKAYFRIKSHILTIAGSDPSGGAGIQTDLKVITALGGYGLSVITALTAQNTLGIQGVFPVPVPFIRRQLHSVLSDIRIDAAKIGMLGRAAAIKPVCQAIKQFNIKKMILDPVMISTSGQSLLETGAVSFLIGDLLPIIALLTPNLSEAAVLAGFPVRTKADMKKAARIIKEKTAGQVLIKGGHLSGAAVDLLYDGWSFQEFSAPRIKIGKLHGTGCSFSAAIAAYWGQGLSLPEAVKGAKNFINKAIAGAEPVGHGQWPIDPLGDSAK